MSGIRYWAEAVIFSMLLVLLVAAAFGKNLTNRLYAQNILRADPTFGALRVWGASRTYGVQVGYRF